MCKQSSRTNCKHFRLDRDSRPYESIHVNRDKVNCRNDNCLILALCLFNCIGDCADALNFAGNHITRLEEVWRHKTHTYSGRCAGSDDGAGF